MSSPPARFYLTGRVAVEGQWYLDQDELHGRQGRLALVRLVSLRHRPVPVGELADALWGSERPRTWETSLRAVVSRLRHSLSRLDPVLRIDSDAGCYQALLGKSWVDIEEAVNAVDMAEGALQRHDTATAWSHATVGAGIAVRPLLPGEDLPWVSELRDHLRGVWVRSLEVLAQVYLADRRYPLAITVSRQLVDAEPYRESGYRHLLRAQLANGDRALALRTYADLRATLLDDLGVEPSNETRDLHLAALRSDGVEAEDNERHRPMPSEANIGIGPRED